MTNMHSPVELVGEPMSAVSFVMDYVEFHFSGPVLRALTGVQVSIAGVNHTFPGIGSRDALCSLIGQTLKAVTLDAGVAARLQFANGGVVTIPLDESSRVGPEAMHFVPGFNQPIAVW